jgi:hypothetical protein
MPLPERAGAISSGWQGPLPFNPRGGPTPVHAYDNLAQVVGPMSRLFILLMVALSLAALPSRADAARGKYC